MINTDAIVFYSVAVIIVIFFFRPVLINIKVGRYVKKYHHDLWGKNIHLFFGGSGGRGANIFQVIKSVGIDDTKIEAYKKDWEKALKRFFLATLLIIIFVICYIIFYQHNSIIGKIIL